MVVDPVGPELREEVVREAEVDVADLVEARLLLVFEDEIETAEVVVELDKASLRQASFSGERPANLNGSSKRASACATSRPV